MTPAVGRRRPLCPPYGGPYIWVTGDKPGPHPQTAAQGADRNKPDAFDVPSGAPRVMRKPNVPKGKSK